MFKKLLSNLPFNPSLIGQVSFYAKRMHSEASVRRLGFVMLLLAMVIQIFSVVSPPEPTLAQSGNDIIEGGFTTRDQAVLHCLNPQRDFLKILEYYGVGCDTLATAETVTLQSTDYERKLDSMGRWEQGPIIERTGKPTEEYRVTIPSLPGGNYFMRNLWAWDTGASSSYKFLRMKNKQGIIVMVMYSCGNIVTIDRYTPPTTPTPPPQKTHLEIRKDRAPEGTVNVGDDIIYSLIYRNSGNATATDVNIKDVIPLNTELVSVQPGGDKHSVSSNNRILEFWHDVPNKAIGYSTSWHVVKYTVRVTRYPSSGNKICNAATIESDQEDVESNEICNTVNKPVATTPPVAPVPPTPVVVPDVPPPVPDTPTAPVTPETPTTPSPTAPNLTLSKKARNVTRNIADANGTQAQAGDTIQYILSVKNTGTAKYSDFVIEENLADVLEYAEITDLSGATVDPNRVVRWPKFDIGAGDTVVRQLTVQVKNPVPNTPVSASHPGSFDLTMTNVYGTAVNISLPGSVVKRTEQVVTTLPNTGPGESMAAVVTIVAIAGYFFARARLMAQEYDIVRVDFASGGSA